MKTKIVTVGAQSNVATSRITFMSADVSNVGMTDKLSIARRDGAGIGAIGE